VRGGVVGPTYLFTVNRSEIGGQKLKGSGGGPKKKGWSAFEFDHRKFEKIPEIGREEMGGKEGSVPTFVQGKN